MNWLSAAERLNAIDRKAVVFSPDRCLHSLDKYAECEECYQICPIKAITPGKTPKFDQDVCQSCLACIPVCPTGVYSAEDAIPALIKCAARIEADNLELACEVHPALSYGVADSEVAVRIRGCLAGMGSGGYLTLFATGKQNVTVRLDACGECPWGELQPKIIDQITEVRTLLNAWKRETKLEIILNVEDMEVQERPVWEAENPPLSRRDLFRFASQRSQLLAARAINASSGASAERRPSANRLRQNAAIEQFPVIEKDIQDLSGFAVISVSKECTACGACERACPTKAIEYSLHEFKTFLLKFQPDHCIGCSICKDICAPDAITINHEPSLKAVYGLDGSQLLIEGEITSCERCNTVIAKKPEMYLCPICEYRRQNPFGGQLPPKLNRLIMSQSKQKTKS